MQDFADTPYPVPADVGAAGSEPIPASLGALLEELGLEVQPVAVTIQTHAAG